MTRCGADGWRAKRVFIDLTQRARPRWDSRATASLSIAKIVHKYRVTVLV